MARFNAKAIRSTFSIRLVLSYIFDWIAIIVLAAIGAAINYVDPYHRPFSLLDLSISYPYVDQQISAYTLVIVSLIAPGIIIFIVVAIFVPGPAFSKNLKRSQIWRLKLWECEKGWAGLALSCAVAFLITQGSKNLFGKPRPDMLARCKPDLTNIAAHVVGGYGAEFNERWQLVSSTICTQSDRHFLNDGFRSFPSGHSSFSWAGLLYLTLFLCSKFAITVPYLPLESNAPDTIGPRSNDHELLPLHHRGQSSEDSAKHLRADQSTSPTLNPATAAAHPIHIRNLGASPPTYLLLPALFPIAVAIYIVSTRYAQFWHFGFDIISGSLIGIITAWLSFRWYHLPLGRGQGWAWGARSKNRAFGIAVGTGGYVDPKAERELQQKRALNAEGERV